MTRIAAIVNGVGEVEAVSLLIRRIARTVVPGLALETPRDQPYDPVDDQAPLTGVFDLDQARERSASFRKMWRAVSSLLTSVAPPS